MSEASIFAILEQEYKTQQKNTRDGGSGGAAKIKLPKNGKAIKSRARSQRSQYASQRHVSAKADKINVIVISNWVRNDNKAAVRLRGALRYNQERERGQDEKERTFFTDKKDNLDRSDIRKEIRDKFGQNIAFHTLILSPGDNSISTKEFTREIMNEWQERLDYQIDYYAVEHKNTEHHHVHVIIPGSSSDRSNDIRLNRYDLTDLREIGNDHIAHERLIDRAFDRATEKEFGFDKQRQYDREFQKEFHLSPMDYKEDQEAAGLSSYEDFARDQKDLGLSYEYSLGENKRASEVSKKVSDDEDRERDDDDRRKQ